MRLRGLVVVWARGQASSRGKGELPRGSSSSNNGKATTRWVPCRICVVHVCVCVFHVVLRYSFVFFVETEGSAFDDMLT